GYIMLKPEVQWPEPKRTHAELLTAIQEEVAKIPGNNYEFSQPIQLRFNELISGVRSDVAVKIFGDDMNVLNETAG
ncbi:efflux RND transporter permease subunit, partial [Escherichia coli]|uniref:efflux RND transporter permease subunit n=1 Tax=Escherichia coli TaxID=562 RepID=UPI003CE4950E